MITPEFVRKQAPMRELQILLDNRTSQPNKTLFAVFYGYEVNECWDFKAFRPLYNT